LPALVLFLAPFVLRFAPLGHGAPRNYVPDTHIVRGALGMAKDKTLVPPPNVYTTYPYLLPYCLLPVYAVEYAGGRATGAWSGVGEFGMRVLEEPWIAQLPARIFVALCGALTPWVLWRAALAAALSRRAALVAAWLVATSLLHVQFSTQERPWVPLVLCIALALWPAALYANSGRTKHLLLVGLCAAGGFSCHQAGAPLIGLAGVAWLAGPLGWRGSELRRRLAQGTLCVGLFALVSLLVGYPFYLVHGGGTRESISGGELLEAQLAADPDAFGPVIQIGGQAIVLQIRLASVQRLSVAFFGYDPLLLVLGIAGLLPALRRRELRAGAIFALGWAAFFLTQRNDHVRYLLPLVALLAFPAALAYDALWMRCEAKGSSGSALSRPGLSASGRTPLAPPRLLLLGLLGFPLLQAARIAWVLRQPDTRALAEQRLAQTAAQAGAPLRVAFDRYAPQVELDQASLERVETWRPLGSRERQRLELLRAGAPTKAGAGFSVVPLEDAWFWDDRKGTLYPNPKVVNDGEDLRAFLQRCGATHVLLVSKRPRHVRDNPLLQLTGGGAPLWRVDPSWRGFHPEESTLPIEMEFPLTQLWQVERPGPTLSLYEIVRGG
jgi:hypothetical protein